MRVIYPFWLLITYTYVLWKRLILLIWLQELLCTLRSGDVYDAFHLRAHVSCPVWFTFPTLNLPFLLTGTNQYIVWVFTFKARRTAWPPYIWPVQFAFLNNLDLWIFLGFVVFQYDSEFGTVLLQTRYKVLLFKIVVKGLRDIDRGNERVFSFDEAAFSILDELQYFSNVVCFNMIEDFAERQRLDPLDCVLRNIGCNCVNQGS